jgi:hypothetical protein
MEVELSVCKSKRTSRADAVAEPILGSHQDHLDIPVIELTTQCQLGVSNDDETHGSVLRANAPPVVATAVPIFEENGAVEALPSPAFEPNRPKFLSVTVSKNSALVSSLGVVLSNGLRVESFENTGLLVNSPVRVGDKLFSINHRLCHNMSRRKVKRLVAKLSGSITFVFHNQKGDSSLVESTVPNPGGIELASTNENGELSVSSIDPSGIFASSLLNAGDNVLSVNGASCQQFGPSFVFDILNGNPTFATVLARISRRNALVLGEILNVRQSNGRLTHSYFSETRVDMYRNSRCNCSATAILASRTKSKTQDCCPSNWNLVPAIAISIAATPFFAVAFFATAFLKTHRMLTA